MPAPDHSALEVMSLQMSQSRGGLCSAGPQKSLDLHRPTPDRGHQEFPVEPLCVLLLLSPQEALTGL